MKKTKLFTKIAIVAMAVVTVFSSGNVARAEEAEVTEKPWIDFELSGVTETRYFADDDFEVIYETQGWFRGSSRIESVSGSAILSINWDNSERTKDEVKEICIDAVNFIRNADGQLEWADYETVDYWSAESGAWEDSVILTQGLVDSYDLSAVNYYGWQNEESCFFTFRIVFSDNSSSEYIYMFDGQGGLFHYKEPEVFTDTAPAEKYTVDLSTSTAPMTKDEFAALLEENKTKDVVIQSNNGVTFTFAAGTMKAVDGKDSYDFRTTLNTTYSSDLPSYVTQSNFVSQINYNYSGQLPAEASIRFYVGTQYAGKTLYYSLMNTDKTFAEVQAVTVDAEGYMTVKQNHCSSYVVTTEEPKTETLKTEAPKTGDNIPILIYSLLGISALGIFVIFRSYKRA